MDLLATGSAVKPGLPARLDDAASDNEKTDEAAIFEVFLGLALTVPSPDAVVVSGPEGKTAPVDATDAASGSTGNPATSTGNILPVALPVGMEPGAQPSLPEANGDDGAEARRSTPAIVSLHARTTVEPEAAMRSLLLNAAPPAFAQVASTEAVASLPSLARLADPLPPAQAATPPAPGAAPEPLPQARPAKAIVVQAIAVAQIAAPVVNLLAGRQRGAEPARGIATPDGPGQAAPAPAVQLATVQPTNATASAEPDSARRQATAPMPGPDAAADAETLQTPATASRPEPAAMQAPGALPVQAEPIAPLADMRAGAQPSGVTVAAPASSSQPPAHDFGGIVDRLVRAREAEQPEMVRSTLATRDFGTVSMQMRQVEGRLHVALSAADPGFAPAVQAASSVAGTGQQALSDNAAQSQSQGQQQQTQGQSAQQSGAGRSTPDGQPRRQPLDRNSEGPSRQGPGLAPGNDASAPAPRGAASGAIYA